MLRDPAGTTTSKNFAPTLLFVLLSSAPIAAQATVAPSAVFAATRISTAPKTDASLSDSAWLGALRATAFENATLREPAALKTTALFLYDDDNLYVGFIAEQPGVPITETQASDDVGYGVDDAVTVSIDTSGNNSRVYSFTATPRGVRYESSSESSRYQPLWSAVTAVAPGSYRVMMTIPLADMRVGNAKMQRWRVNFSRYVAADGGDLLTWAYDSSSSSYCNGVGAGATVYCDATRWPIMTGIALTNVVRVPPAYGNVYGLASLGRDHDVFETMPETFTHGSARNFGLDATVPFTRSLAFVTTIGPDFSNVEADQTTIAPQEFPIQFAEYRPFFAEGSNYIAPLVGFNVVAPNNQMFYSPSLGIVDDGFKVEGTTGSSAVGALDAKGMGFNDQAFGYQFAMPDGSLTLAFEGVNANHTGVVDRTIGGGLTFQNLHSGITLMANFEQENGTLVSSPKLARQTIVGGQIHRNVIDAGLFYTDIGPEFSPIDGYTSANDVRGVSAFGHYQGPAPARTIMKSYDAGIQVDRFLDRSGVPHQVDANAHASVEFKNLLSIGFAADHGQSRDYAQAYPVYSGAHSDAFDANTVNLGFRDGTPSPTDAYYTFGSFAVQCPSRSPTSLPCATAINSVVPAFTQQFNVTSTRAISGGYGLSLQYGATVERPFSGTSDAQVLRRLSVSRSMANDMQYALSIQSINGTGGFASPGTSLAVSFHKRFRDQSQLYLEYGSPAARRTVQRFVLKYVHHVGKGGAGT